VDNENNKQRDRTFALILPILHTIKSPSVVTGTIDHNMSDARAAQIVVIFGTLWMMLVWLQMLKEHPLGEALLR
jgi:hypothetical protein